MTQIIPVILSGGTGTRLWPVSRAAHPKPFMQLPDGETLLAKAFKRAFALPNASRALILTNEKYQFSCQAEFDKLTFDSKPQLGYLLEPAVRSTGPALALAAEYVAQFAGPEAVMLVLAADHLILNQAAFAAAASQAVAAAESGKLVCFGIEPTRPETGYGYIELGSELAENVFQIARFREKPDAATAQQFIDSGHFKWNSGMFAFRADALLAAFRQHADWHGAAAQVWTDSKSSADSAWPAVEIAKTFAELPEISIDFAIMEKVDNAAVVPCDIDWSDIGAWPAVAELQPAGESGNRAVGDAIFIDSKDNFAESDRRLIATVGVENLMIVDTADAVLIAHKDKAQDVKKIVDELKKRRHPAFEFHQTVHRPWGSFTTLQEGPGFKVKLISVKPGAELSLQMHHHRSEHWVVVAGTAMVHNDGREFLLRTNESTYIQMGHTHRLANPGMLELQIIEVQVGQYLGEDDIVRFEDKYGRK